MSWTSCRQGFRAVEFRKGTIGRLARIQQGGRPEEGEGHGRTEPPVGERESDRPGAPPGRAALRPGAGPHGSRGHQGGTPGRRGDPLPRPLGQKAVLLLGPVQLGQEVPLHRPQEGRREGGAAGAGQGLGRGGAELPARHHREDGLRLREPEGAEPAHHHGECLGLRAVRALQGQHRLRPHRPDHVGDHHGHG